ncbi:NmrA family NAD(P)-binding protein [Deinococcus pimensis]|uniref:NmrA family NAD(P)-binding protein n=1 Tax=Deinococcus pimensis TaxID=309888 RepID=UPI0004857DA3|nr:NmrA family NAD(P)-binding protein [Deinococcus pimensis]
MNTILVTGATGSQGNPVARRLVEAGHRVRVLTRAPERAAPLAALGAEVVRGDLDDAPALREAVRGADGVFLHVPFFTPSPTDGPRYAHHVVDAAREEGVRLLVWNASGEIPPARGGNPAFDARIDVLETIEGSGVPYVVLQPTAYMENFLGPWTREELARDGTFAYPTPLAVRMQWLATEDLGAFAAHAFAHPELANLNLKVCGPERLDGEEVAERFSRALGRPVRFRAMPPAEFGEKLDAVFPGMGRGAAAGYELAYRQPERMSSHVDLAETLRVMPVRLTSLEEWARAHAAAFAPAPEGAPG